MREDVAAKLRRDGRVVGQNRGLRSLGKGYALLRSKRHVRAAFEKAFALSVADGDGRAVLFKTRSA